MTVDVRGNDGGQPQRSVEVGEFLSDHRELADLVEATRRLMSAAALSTVDNERLRRATSEIDRIAGELSASSREQVPRLMQPGSFRGRVLSTADPVLGLLNPVAGPLAVVVGDDETARATWTCGALFEGPPGSVHGGYSAMVMDAVMGTLLRALGTRALTGSLTLRYLAPTPLGRPLEASARVLSRDGRKITVEGGIRCDGTPTVRASGLFVEVPVPAPALGAAVSI